MNTPELPAHIGGYQHLQSFVPIKTGDIFVDAGRIVAFADNWIGCTVGQAEAANPECHIYRRIPVAKQGDIDHRGVPATPAQPDVPWDRKPGVVAFRAFGCNALPTDAKARKATPVYSGFLKYFPRAIAEVARVSQAGNDQHNPGKPLHWDRSKSGDELDALSRHLLEAGGIDTDGQRHSAKLVWRALANLEKELEGAE